MVDTALRIADAEGLEAVTIRRLAQELSVTPMAPYWHFKDKDALLAAMADRMWDDTAAELDRSTELAAAAGQAAAAGEVPPDGWAPLRRTLEALVCVLARHPAVAPLAPMRVVECESGLAVTEQTLAFLAGKGFPSPRAAEAARFVLMNAIMLVSTQPGADITQPVERAEVQRRKKIALASLPPDRYPEIVAAAEYLTDCDDSERYYDRGMDLVLAAISNQVLAADEKGRAGGRS